MRGAAVLILLLMRLQWCLLKEFRLTILHNNDIHGRFEEDTATLTGQTAGGIGRILYTLKTARAEAEREGAAILYLNAGDTYTGSAWFSVHTWRIAVDVMNLLGTDAMCLGNHEFDKGIDGLLPFLNAANFPVLAANVDFSEEPELASSNIRPSTIIELKGKKIGIVGYLTPFTQLMGRTRKIIFEDEIPSIKRECQRLLDKGVNIIIALGHSGFLQDKLIAENVEALDLVVGGHTKTLLWNGKPPDIEVPTDSYPVVIRHSSGKIVPVLHAYGFSKYMGKIRLAFNSKGDIGAYSGTPIFLGNIVPQEMSALRLLERYRPGVDKLNEEVIANSYVYLSSRECRETECNFGNLVTDSMVDYVTCMYKGDNWTDTALAVLNAGAIRRGVGRTLEERNITRGDLLGAMPFEEIVASVTLTGRALVETLEIGARSNGETSRGEFLQVSGIHVSYDMRKSVGSRVTSVRVRCAHCTVPAYEPVDLGAEYRVITTLFLIYGGDGHTALKNKHRDLLIYNITVLESAELYIEKKKVLYTEKNERIKVLNSVSKIYNFNVLSLIYLTIFQILFIVVL